MAKKYEGIPPMGGPGVSDWIPKCLWCGRPLLRCTCPVAREGTRTSSPDQQEPEVPETPHRDGTDAPVVANLTLQLMLAERLVHYLRQLPERLRLGRQEERHGLSETLGQAQYHATRLGYALAEVARVVQTERGETNEDLAQAKVALIQELQSRTETADE